MGDLLTPGGTSNYQGSADEPHLFHGHGERGGLAAALARGDAPERVYIIEPTGAFENDPNVTDQKFPAIPPGLTAPCHLRITGEITGGRETHPEALQHYRNKLNQSSGEIIN